MNATRRSTPGARESVTADALALRERRGEHEARSAVAAVGPEPPRVHVRWIDPLTRTERSGPGGRRGC